MGSNPSNTGSALMDYLSSNMYKWLGIQIFSDKTKYSWPPLTALLSQDKRTHTAVNHFQRVGDVDPGRPQWFDQPFMGWVGNI